MCFFDEKYRAVWETAWIRSQAQRYNERMSIKCQCSMSFSFSAVSQCSFTE